MSPDPMQLNIDPIRLRKFLLAWFQIDAAEEAVRRQRQALIAAYEDALPIGAILTALSVEQRHRAQADSRTNPVPRSFQAELEHFIGAVLDHREDQAS
jgi:hypothetical protein